ncbi:PfkB family carbohydrate kinase [Proteiniborus sp. MB09-C3]|uniref:carbohydrate kinase family protein n=1 Tax=Proteiniborus sp. MB09-C3 TaxID=3050072 RepID=UPI0025526570|nr:PfkB family carbohydrate kinase [Proteiniborus sp. MB09-C3]WIV11622.1 PfkB family carbohydrate kinase [Proteiniborus sp. MB09-C3]
MKYDIVTSGYISMDRIIKVESPLEIGYTSIISNSDNTKVYYGGCPINISCILGKLGLKALPIIRVGEDADTAEFIKYLESANVILDAVDVIKGESSSNCYIVSDKNNNHVTIFYPGAMDSKYSKDMADEFFAASKLGVLTVGSYKDNLEFYNKCKKYKLPIVFGTKLDYDAFPKDFLKEIMLNSKIIFSNESEAKDIISIMDIDDITDLFKLGSAEIIVTTLGENGSQYYAKTTTGFETEKIRPCKAERVADATGAGDAYISGFLYGYLNDKSIRESCYMGSVMSSFIIESVGCTTNAPSYEVFSKRYEAYLKSI